MVDAGFGLSYAVTDNTALTAGVSYAERFSDDSGDGMRELWRRLGSSWASEQADLLFTAASRVKW